VNDITELGPGWTRLAGITQTGWWPLTEAGSRIASQDRDDRRRVIIKFSTCGARTSVPAADSLEGHR
jgi:hypothetical protein